MVNFRSSEKQCQRLRWKEIEKTPEAHSGLYTHRYSAPQHAHTPFWTLHMGAQVQPPPHTHTCTHPQKEEEEKKRWRGRGEEDRRWDAEEEKRMGKRHHVHTPHSPLNPLCSVLLYVRKTQMWSRALPGLAPPTSPAPPLSLCVSIHCISAHWQNSVLPQDLCTFVSLNSTA